MLRRMVLMLAAVAVVSLVGSVPAEGQLLKKLRGKGKKSETSDEGKESKKKSKKDADRRCEDVSLEWLLEEDYSDLDSVNLTGISSLPVEVGAFADKRRIEDPREFGRNVEDADDDDPEDRKTLYATTDDDFAAFVTKYTEEVLAELGYNVVEPGEGAVKIAGDLRAFHAEEDSTYKATTRMLMKVTTKSGAVIYEGMHSESETTFGRSYKCENYFQVLSESLMETVHSLAVKDEFYEALAKVAR